VALAIPFIIQTNASITSSTEMKLLLFKSNIRNITNKIPRYIYNVLSAKCSNKTEPIKHLSVRRCLYILSSSYSFTLVFRKYIVNVVSCLFRKLVRNQCFKYTFVNERVFLSLSEIAVQVPDFLQAP